MSNVRVTLGVCQINPHLPHTGAITRLTLGSKKSAAEDGSSSSANNMVEHLRGRVEDGAFNIPGLARHSSDEGVQGATGVRQDWHHPGTHGGRASLREATQQDPPCV